MSIEQRLHVQRTNSAHSMWIPMELHGYVSRLNRLHMLCTLCLKQNSELLASLYPRGDVPHTQAKVHAQSRARNPTTSDILNMFCVESAQAVKIHAAWMTLSEQQNLKSELNATIVRKENTTKTKRNPALIEKGNAPVAKTCQKKTKNKLSDREKLVMDSKIWICRPTFSIEFWPRRECPLLLHPCFALRGSREPALGGRGDFLLKTYVLGGLGGFVKTLGWSADTPWC